MKYYIINIENEEIISEHTSKQDAEDNFEELKECRNDISDETCRIESEEQFFGYRS